jgi:nucleoside-diphosphate-sugar epimerase
MSPRALVLGAGQVGTFAVRALAEAGADVVAADLQPAIGYFARFGAADVELVQADLLDAAAVRSLVRAQEPAVVVLTAGLVGEACERDPDLARKLNADAAGTVARIALEERMRRVVAVSSLSVYGRPRRAKIDETTPLRPQSTYGRTKAAGERALLAVAGKGLDVRILRPCGVYGPARLDRGSHSARVLESALVRVLRGDSLTIAAGPATSDQYLYVKDLGRALAIAALDDLTSSERIFNIAPPEKTTAEELRRVLQAIAPGSAISIVADGDRRRSMPPLDGSLFRRVAGFVPEYDLQAGLEDYAREAGFR